jgi:DNA-binding MarR family transcriptional regulator
MTAKHVASVRAFNRFYTDVIGLLDRFILDSKYSLPEVRVMFELYHQPGLTAKQIMASFRIDKGYLSRILEKLQKRKLLQTRSSATDGRAVLLELTAKGSQEFEQLNEASNTQVRSLLAHLDGPACDALTNHMTEIKKLLSNNTSNE